MNAKRTVNGLYAISPRFMTNANDEKDNIAKELLFFMNGIQSWDIWIKRLWNWH